MQIASLRSHPLQSANLPFFELKRHLSIVQYRWHGSQRPRTEDFLGKLSEISQAYIMNYYSSEIVGAVEQ